MVCNDMIDTLSTYRWIVDIDGPVGTLYEGEHFQLLFKFRYD